MTPLLEVEDHGLMRTVDRAVTGGDVKYRSCVAPLVVHGLNQLPWNGRLRYHDSLADALSGALSGVVSLSRFPPSVVLWKHMTDREAVQTAEWCEEQRN